MVKGLRKEDGDWSKNIFYHIFKYNGQIEIWIIFLIAKLWYETMSNM